MKMHLRITYGLFMFLHITSTTLWSEDLNTNYLLQKIFTDGEVYNASTAAAISGDGNTIAMGLSTYSEIFTFTRTNGVWTSQPVSIGECRAIDEEISLALSYGGDVLAIGLPSCGRAYVFIRLNYQWILQVQIGRDAYVGQDVSLSLDGTVCAIGAPGITGYRNGTVYIFERSGYKWSLPRKITRADDGEFGSFICLSGDGNTLAVNNNNQGLIYIYYRSENNWLPPYVISDPSEQLSLTYVTLTEDGKLLAVSGIDTSYSGAVWIYEKKGKTWQLREKITVSDSIGFSSFENADIAFANNGTLLVAGSGADNVTRGAVWVFEHNDNVWSEAQKIVASPLFQYFGGSIGVSASGDTIVGTSFFNENSTGAALVYDNQNGKLFR